jgi:hypothetical protein
MGSIMDSVKEIVEGLVVALAERGVRKIWEWLEEHRQKEEKE